VKPASLTTLQPATVIMAHEVLRGSATSANRSPEALPVVVDMESEALLQVARASGIEFMVLRVITDTPQKPLPDFVATWSRAALDKDASLVVRGIFEALAQPREVWRLLRHGRKWQRALTSLWAECSQYI